MEHLHFYFEGESFTRTVRDLWDSGLIENAFGALEGMTTEDMIKLCTGKLKFTGCTKDEPHELNIEEDNFETEFSVERQVEIYENILSDCVNSNGTIQRKLMLSKTKTSEACEYRTKYSSNDRKTIENNNKKIKQALTNLNFLYPTVGKTMIDLSFTKMGTMLSTIELDYMEKNKFEQRIDREDGIETEPETEYIKPIPTKTIEGLNGWLSPEGEFYFCEYMGHRLLADLLAATSIIPNDIPNEQAWLDEHKWIKFQGREFVQWEMIPTNTQLEVMVEYWHKDNNDIYYNGQTFKSVTDFMEFIEEGKVGYNNYEHTLES